MTTLSVSVPKDLKKRMASLDEINWSAVARKAFEEKVNQVEILKQISCKSKLTAKDAQTLSKKINKSMAKKFRGM
jgi:hypothetical protein